MYIASRGCAITVDEDPAVHPYTYLALRAHEVRLLARALQLAHEELGFCEEDSAWLETARRLVESHLPKLRFEDPADPAVAARWDWARMVI